MKHFDDIAEYYDNLLPEHVNDHYYLKRIGFLTKLVKEGNVLDVCSGTGRISGGLIEKGFNVVSLDSSTNMLSMRMHIKGYQPVKGISYGLPFLSGVFDLVVSIASFHHIAESEKIKLTIDEIKRVTRKGGHIVLWDHNPYNPYWKILMKKVPQDTGEERLIGLREMVEPFESGEYFCSVFRKGFVPDFAPKKLMKIFEISEKIVEFVPILNLCAAHNVIVAKKL